MNKEYALGIVGLLLGVIITLAVQGFTANEGKKGYTDGSDNMHKEMMHGDSMKDSMNMMTGSLKGKSGDEFDKAFLSEMIVHHQGAVEMANLALQSANHQEIKDLANAIVSAQTKEIGQMKEWEKAWFK